MASAAIIMIIAQVQSIEFSKHKKCPNNNTNSIQIENQGFICLNEITHCNDHN